MSVHLGFYNTSSTRTHVRFQFSTHAASGANVAPSSSIDAADIRIYKATDGAAFSATQRSSSNGITCTSPFDSLTGFHDVDIDLTDNTDASFYVAGFYSVVLAPSDETIDSLVITGKVLAYFEIGVSKADVTQFGGTAGTFSSGRPEVNTTHAAGTAWASGAITAASIATGAIDADAIADGAIDAGAFAANAITAAKLDPDVTTELQSGLATAAALATVDGIVDDILLDTAEIGTAGAGLTNINLPNQTMDIVGNITGNLSGSVGSVTGHTNQTGDAYARLGAPAGASVSADIAAMKVDTAAILVDTGTTLDGKIDTIDTIVDAITAITSAIGATAAANLARTLGSAGVVYFTAATGTLSVTQATTNLSEATNDHYIGRTIVWLTGALAGQVTDVTDYAGSGGLLTFTAVTDTPSNGDTGILV